MLRLPISPCPLVAVFPAVTAITGTDSPSSVSRVTPDPRRVLSRRPVYGLLVVCQIYRHNLLAFRASGCTTRLSASTLASVSVNMQRGPRHKHSHKC